MRAWGRRPEPAGSRPEPWFGFGFWFAFVLGLTLILGLPAAPAEDEKPAEPVWTSYTSGLETFGISSLRIHPKRPNRLLAHVHGLGVAESTDGGKTWNTLHEGIDPKDLPGPHDPCVITLDGRDEDTLWLAMKGKTYRSRDGGTLWEPIKSNALTSWSWDKRESRMMIRGFAVDPRKSLHVFAGTWTEALWRGGLYETLDGGKTWELVAGSDEQDSELGFDAWPIILDPRTDKNVAVGGSEGFWVSDDRGRHFRRADPGEIGVHRVQFITPMSARNRDVYLCDRRGLWASRDGGRRWDKRPKLEGDCVTAFADPRSRKRLFAVLRNRGLMISEDGAHKKWKGLGYADLDIEEIVVPARTKNLMYFASPVTGLH
ncbi:MAG: WD40/YVTN/BNR-like repeat-containing protein, partial [Planctomycetota bacterium]